MEQAFVCPPCGAPSDTTSSVRNTTAPPPPYAMDAQTQSILDAMPHMLWWQQGSKVYRNPRWTDAIGPHPEMHWLQRVHPDDRSNAQRRWRNAQTYCQDFQMELRLQHQTGQYRWVLASVHCHSAHPSATLTLSCTDIHERVTRNTALAQSSKLQTSMLDASIDCIKILHPQGTVEHMNRAGCLALGIPVGTTSFGMHWLDLLAPEVRTRGQRALHLARSGQHARFAGTSTANGQTQHWDNILTPMQDAQGNTTAILCVSRDVTLQREAQRRLRVASERDDLTGLFNRRAFNRQLQLRLHQARKEQRSIGLLLIDLDHFKHINDTLGHPAGDHLLRVLGKRLESAVGNNGFVARLGGDEFAVVVTQADEEDHVLTVAAAVLQQIQTPIHYSGKLINGGMSIGCAMFPRDADSATPLMKKADTALHDLKADGRGGIRMFDPHMTVTAERTASQLDSARHVVRECNVHAHFQPKVRLLDGQTVGFEALMRWQCPQRGMQSPHALEEAFNDFELASKIAEMMQEQVLHTMVQWRAQGLEVLPVSINAAPVEFFRDDYAERLLERIHKHGIPPHLLEVEITEHMLADRGSAYVLRAVRVLKQAGLRIALDDFGTGHSSLAHLRDYPIDAIKIDIGFVRRMVQEPSILAIVEAIASLGPKMRLDVIAEGVETQMQRRILLRAGCTKAQGYLYSPAVTAEQAMGMLQPQPLPEAVSVQ